MHDGRFKTLAEVVIFTTAGRRPGADTLRPLGLSALEKADFAFLMRSPAAARSGAPAPGVGRAAGARRRGRGGAARLSATDRRELRDAAGLAVGETLAQACLAPALERVTRALAAAARRGRNFDDAVRLVYLAWRPAAKPARPCGLQHVSSASRSRRSSSPRLLTSSSCARPRTPPPRAVLPARPCLVLPDLGEDEVSALAPRSPRACRVRPRSARRWGRGHRREGQERLRGGVPPARGHGVLLPRLGRSALDPAPLRGVLAFP